MRKIMLRSAAVLATLALAACYDNGPETSLTPPDYSPDYVRMSVVSEDGKQKRVLVPEACLTPDEPSPADSGPARLPPGCANNYNLQRMADRERDLTRGRTLGPAPAGPAARAAKGYIEGEKKEPVLGGGVRDSLVTSGAETTIEPR